MILAILGALLLALISGALFVALVNLADEEEDEGRVSEGWLREERRRRWR